MGAPGSTQSGGSDQSFASGPLTITAKAGASPITRVGGSSSTNVLDISGASFTNVLASFPKTLDNTFILYGQGGQVWSVTPNFGSPTELTTLNNFNYPVTPTMNAIGRIAYGKPDVSSAINQIFVMNGDGTNDHRITDGTTHTGDPCWAPDNTTLYVFLNVAGTYMIAKMSSGGGAPTAIESSTSDDTEPSVAANGTMAFTHANSTSGHREVWTMTTAGTNKILLGYSNVGDVWHPSISPDGSKVLVTSVNGGTSDIWMLDVATGSGDQLSKAVTGEQYSFATWAPDGRHMVFLDYDGTSTTHLDTATFDMQNRQELTSSTSLMYHPRWSPWLANKLYVGTGGTFGNASSGFILGQNNGAIASFLNVISNGGIFTNIAPDPNNPFVQKISLQSAGTFASLQFENGLWTGPITVPVSNTHQVLASYDANGLVTLVAPISKMSSAPRKMGGATVYVGEFPAVYDCHGKNLAPNGASQISLGTETGKLISIK